MVRCSVLVDFVPCNSVFRLAVLRFRVAYSVVWSVVYLAWDVLCVPALGSAYLSLFG